MLQSWLAKQVISFVMSRTRRGDPRATLALDAPDVELTFPGRNSWSGVFRGRHEVQRWLRRFVALGLQIYPDEVVAIGPPWSTTVCVRGRDDLRGPDGEIVYANRFVIWGHMTWGRLKRYEVYQDTHAPDELDGWIAAHRPELAGRP